MPDELAVAVVGTGRMGAFHVRAWTRVPGARVVAVADPNESARRRALSGLAAASYDDWRRLLDSAVGTLDAISIACPSELHAEVTLAALEVGLNVLVEKPIAVTLPDALRMRGAAREAGRKLMVGHVERFNPVVRLLRELLEQNRLGRIFRAQATRVGPLPRRIRDAGVAIDLATHDLDVMQHVLGRQVAEIYADGGQFLHQTREDLLTCLARFAPHDDPGVLGLLDVNWLTPEPRRELTLNGELGILSASYSTQQVRYVPAPDVGGEPVRFSVAPTEPLLAEIEAFTTSVLEDLPEPVSAHDGVRALAAALAVRESAATRRPVTLLDMPTPAPLKVAA